MGKLHEAIYGKDHPDKAGTHYAWYWWCPGCKSIHSCDSRWGFNGNQETVDLPDWKGHDPASYT